MAKKIKYIYDGVQGKDYIRAWKENRQIIVQVWKDQTTAIGEPDGDWEMPAVLGFPAAVAQAAIQTDRKPLFDPKNVAEANEVYKKATS